MEEYERVRKHLACAFMDYLDKNRVDGKMCLSTPECIDIDEAFKAQDWAKLDRYTKKYLKG